MELLQPDEIQAVSGGDFTVGDITVAEEPLGNGYTEQMWFFPDGTMEIKVIRTDASTYA